MLSLPNKGQRAIQRVIRVSANRSPLCSVSTPGAGEGRRARAALMGRTFGRPQGRRRTAQAGLDSLPENEHLRSWLSTPLKNATIATRSTFFDVPQPPRAGALLLQRTAGFAGEKVKFQGFPARICWLPYGERVKMDLVFNDLASGDRGVKIPSKHSWRWRVKRQRMASPRGASERRSR